MRIRSSHVRQADGAWSNAWNKRRILLIPGISACCRWKTSSAPTVVEVHNAQPVETGGAALLTSYLLVFDKKAATSQAGERKELDSLRGKSWEEIR